MLRGVPGCCWRRTRRPPAEDNRMPVPRVCVLMVFAMMVAAQQRGPQRDQAPTFAAQTNLVVVPVVVLDHGHPVSHLRRDDFQIQENGRGQKVAAF